MSFSGKYKAEHIYLGFDYSNRLDTGETISSATFTIEDAGSVDATVSSMLSGASVISAGIVKIKVIEGKVGHKYNLSCSASTSGGRILVAKDTFEVK